MLTRSTFYIIFTLKIKRKYVLNGKSKTKVRVISNEALKISDMAEVASARNRFDAALQLLVDKRDDGYDIL